MKETVKKANPTKPLHTKGSDTPKANEIDKALNANTSEKQKPFNRFLEASCDCV